MKITFLDKVRLEDKNLMNNLHFLGEKIVEKSMILRIKYIQIEW